MNDTTGFKFQKAVVSSKHPTLLYKQNDHEIYWLGMLEETAFRCNTYLIKDQHKAWLVDPGTPLFFNKIKAFVEQIIPLSQLDGLIICHQDPDVAASIVDWIKLCPTLKIFTTPRTQVLLPYYGVSNYEYFDVLEHSELKLSSGKALQFIESPFLHFPGAFVTYDQHAQALFSGDIFAAIDINWKLIVDNFEEHIQCLDLFHKDYMASNIATRGFVGRIEMLPIKAIFPQHGSIITEKDVAAALEYLKNLRCGTDIIYAYLSED